MVQTVNGNQTRAQRPAAASIIILSVNLRPYAFNPFLVGADQISSNIRDREHERKDRSHGGCRIIGPKVAKFLDR